MTYAKKILMIAALASVTTASGVALAQRGAGMEHWGDKKCFSEERAGMKSSFSRHKDGQRHHAALLKQIPEEKQSEAKALIRNHREKTMDLRQQMMNHRFDLKRLVRHEKWNEEEVRKQTTAMSKTLSELMLQKAHMKHTLRRLAGNNL
ncbi:MAG: hypothetical protein HQL72_12025 [Magnetococcales bacterium]|nr:hypothetical protein [Magnetococcales bacterium]